MTRLKGFAELRTPKDLIRKLEHDFGRVKKWPGDQYAVFDFFVTAEHIVDWIYPDSKIDQRNFRASCSLLQITSHIANGCKHFEAKATHHKSVEEIEKSRYVQPGYVEEGYFRDPVIVHFSPEEQESLGRSSMEAYELAGRVLDFWREYESKL